jgi:hypothetical protein
VAIALTEEETCPDALEGAITRFGDTAPTPGSRCVRPARLWSRSALRSKRVVSSSGMARGGGVEAKDELIVEKAILVEARRPWWCRLIG